MTKITYYTKEGLEKLKKELDHLKNVERLKASQAIAEARDKGDLSENAEYDAAKEAQGHLEAKIAKKQEVLANARVLDKTTLDSDKVSILSKILLKNKQNNTEMSYTLVAPSEVNLAEGKISIESPIGKGLLGKKIGEVAKIEIPNGSIDLEIIKIDNN